MHFYIWTHDDGYTDMDFKKGDIFLIQPDNIIPTEEELKRWLVVKISGNINVYELLSPEYAPGPGSDNIIRRIRKYKLHYIPKLTDEELEKCKDDNQIVPIIENRFSLEDIVRK